MDLRSKLEQLQQVYNNTDEEIVEDEVFDAIQTYYNSTSGQTYNPIGAKTSEGDVPLPQKMPSVNKIKGDNADDLLTKHYNTYGEDNIYEYKLDGISLLVCYDDGVLNVYKRGDGDVGPNINHILDHVQFPKVNFTSHYRAELMMTEEVFEEIKPYVKSKGKTGENSRSVINGATTKINIDPVILSRCIPVFYEVMYVKDRDIMNPIDQLDFMSSLGMTVVPYVQINSRMNRQQFDQYIDECRKSSPYRIDGIIVIPNKIIQYERINRNPDHIFAYKKDSTAVTEVLRVEWNITSKDGYLNPVVYYRPIKLLGSVFSEFTGHNARFILEKGINPGAIMVMRVNGDVIPGYDSTIIRAERIFAPDCDCEWTTNSKGENVELKLRNPDAYPQVHCMKIKYFIDRLKIKEWGLTTIWKLYTIAGITNVSRLVNATLQELSIPFTVDGKLPQNLFNELQKGIENAKLNQIMAGSGFFGEGISENLLDKFLEEFPTWKFRSPTYDEILSKRDFGPVRAHAIADNIEAFKDWLSQHPRLEKRNNYNSIEKKSNKLVGYTVNFTGFTDELLVNQIKEMGGIFKDTFVKSANIIVVKSMNDTQTIKMRHALDNPTTVKLYTRDQFCQLMTQMRMEL